MMTLRAAVLGTTLFAALAFAGPAQAQSNLPPDVTQAIFELMQAAQMQCQMGNPQGCTAVQEIQQDATRLDQAAAACRQQNQQACGYYQSSVQQLAIYYQQYQISLYAQQSPQGPQAPVSPEQHQLNMQQMQNQFNQHNENWAANQDRLSQQNQQFLDTLLQ